MMMMIVLIMMKMKMKRICKSFNQNVNANAKIKMCPLKCCSSTKKKRKQNGQTFCKYYYNIFCHLFILFAGVCECVGVCGVCAGYFIIFAGCMIINLHLNHRHRRPCRRPCRADDWPVQFLLFFSSCLALFFQGCCSACGPLFGRPCRLCVCVCVDIHTTLLTTKCHMILF